MAKCASEQMTETGRLVPCPGMAQWKHPRYEPMCDTCKKKWEQFFPSDWTRLQPNGADHG